LTRWTISGIVTFFMLALALSMVHIYANSHKKSQYSEINLDGAIGSEEPSEG
jgi:preprotein translocase subunit SecG